MEAEGTIMFDRVKSFVKGVVQRMFPVKTMKEALNVNTCMSEKMQEKIDLWIRMYNGEAPWCKDYVKSLRIEQGICREFANVCLNEMETNISIEKLDKIYKKATRDLNENLQDGLALGGFVIKPLGSDSVEFITADEFIPISFDEKGRLIDVIFVQLKTVSEKEYYRRFERHSLHDKVLTISNRAFKSDSKDVIGREISLNSVEEWRTLPEQVSYRGMEKPDFGYYKNPIKNRIDKSGCGVSIFDSAIEQLKNVDIQGARLDWEFESGERAINVDPIALEKRAVVENGKTVYVEPKLNKRLYHGVGLAAGENAGDLYKEWSPEFRDESIINGYNEYLRQVEFDVSLSYGDLSKVSEVEKTAEEIKASKQRKYNMVKAIQENLKECLEDLAYALAFYNAMLRSGYEFYCNFKDSVLTNEEIERQKDREDVAAGLMKPWEYRMRHYGEDEKTAKKMVGVEEEVIE